MSIGAKDKIDQLLVKKYAKQQVDNHDMINTSMVSAEKMMEAMNDYAAVHMNVMFMSNKISALCNNLKAKARYSPRVNIQSA